MCFDDTMGLNMFFFSEYLVQKSLDTAFEEYDIVTLAATLREFYASLRTRDGRRYSKSVYVNIRASMNHHLNSPPFNREVNIMRDKAFMNSNQVFVGVIRQLRLDGMDLTQLLNPSNTRFLWR